LAQGYYSFGILHGSHFSLADSLQAGNRLSGAYVASAMALGLCALYLARRAWLSGGARSIISCVAFAQSAMLAICPGFSPQFMVWVMPFAAILLSPGAAICSVVWMTALGLSERVLYFNMLPDTPWILSFLVGVRTASFILLAFMFAWQLLPWHPRLSFSSKAIESLSVTGILALLAFSGAFAHVVRREMLSRYSKLNRYSAAIDTISSLGCPKDMVIVTSEEALVSLRPHLSTLSALLLTHEDFEDQIRWEKAQSKLSATLQRHERVWLLLDSSVSLNHDLHTALLNRIDPAGYPAYEQWIGNGQWLGAYLLHEPNKWQTLRGARFEDGTTLAKCEVEDLSTVPGAGLRLRLTWYRLTPEAGALSVFLHIVGQHGFPLAQRDARLPGGPVAASGEEVTQRLGLTVPLSVPPGQYTLTLGIYDASSGQRLRTADGADSLVLAAIEVRPRGR
jgi:hypothetical protein